MAHFSSYASRDSAPRRGADPQDDEAPRTRWTVFDIAIVLALITFSAVRYDLGTDWDLYWRNYQVLDPAASWTGQISYLEQDIGYTWTALVAKSVSDYPFAIFWVTSALTVAPVYAVLKKESRYLPLALLLYICLAFYLAPLNIVRQGVAFALNFWAYSFLGRKRGAVPFVLLNAMAVSFHASAAIAVVGQLIVRRWRPTPKSAALVFVTGALLAGGLAASGLLQRVLSALNPRYESYAVAGQESGVGTYLVILAFAGLALLTLLLRAYVERSDWLAMAIVSTIPLMVGTNAVQASRLYFYFAIFTVLLVPNALERYGKTGKAGPVAAGVVIASLGFFTMYLLNFSDLVPYRTYL